MDLPIRRPRGGARGVVAAFTEELDAWARSQFKAKESSLDPVLKELSQLKKDNEGLRAMLEKVSNSKDSTAVALSADVSLQKRCLEVLQRSRYLRLECTELLATSRKIQALLASPRVNQ